MQRTTLSISVSAETMITGICRQTWWPSDVGEHAITVETRHHHVKQDQIDRLMRENF